jgi:hypothetical protein
VQFLELLGGRSEDVGDNLGTINSSCSRGKVDETTDYQAEIHHDVSAQSGVVRVAADIQELVAVEPGGDKLFDIRLGDVGILGRGFQTFGRRSWRARASQYFWSR